MLFPELVGEINRRLSIDGPAVGGDARHVELKFKNGLLITFSLLEGDATRLAANRAQIHAFIDMGLRKHGEGATVRAVAPRRKTA